MTGSEITRREALRRAAYVLGGTLSAPTILGVLAGCERAAPRAGTAYTPGTLTAQQDELVATIAEHIIPATDTPGARATKVNEFVDAMLSHYYPVKERDRFVAGLARVDARAQAAHGKPFVNCTPEEQVAILTEFDRAAYAKPGATPAEAKRDPTLAAEKNPVTQQGEGKVSTGRSSAPGAVMASGAVSVDGKTDPDDAGQHAFFRTMKELTLVGYYTSEAGATTELHVAPFGPYRADVPLAQIGRAWA